MSKVKATKLPEHALLQRYRDPVNHTDCFTTRLARAVTLPDYVTAFYTTRLFKAERVLLGYLAAKPSTDQQAAQLGRGEIEAFAAWTVEDRESTQLLLRDSRGRTCSWLMVEPVAGAETQLYFGSAVIGSKSSGTIGLGFRLLMGFHKRYSVALLSAAAAKLRASGGN